jgi:hypothetical protein
MNSHKAITKGHTAVIIPFAIEMNKKVSLSKQILRILQIRCTYQLEDVIRAKK